MIAFSFKRLRYRFDNNRFLTEPLEHTGAARKRQPAQQPLQRVSGNKQRRGRRNPQAETVETVDQASGQASAQQAAKSRDQVCRAVLARQQVSDSPRGEYSQKEPPPEIRYAHRAPPEKDVDANGGSSPSSYAHAHPAGAVSGARQFRCCSLMLPPCVSRSRRPPGCSGPDSCRRSAPGPTRPAVSYNRRASSRLYPA